MAEPERPLWLGSGQVEHRHTQGGGRVAGVIKMVMAMRHGELPMSLHREPSRRLTGGRQVRLLTEPVAGPMRVGRAGRRCRRSGSGHQTRT